MANWIEVSVLKLGQMTKIPLGILVQIYSKVKTNSL